MNPNLVIAPTFSFAEVKRRMEAAGWARDPDPTAPSPILPGEPELASWHAPDGTRAVYSFNPAMHLRVLTFEGASAAGHANAAAGQLPTLSPQDVAALLEAEQDEKLLLGVYAAGALRLLPLAPKLTELTRHPDELVAKSATKVLERLLLEAAKVGAERLVEEKRRRPDRSVLFAHVGDAHERRQILRWLMHDYAEANPHILELLRSGLEDSDWEVRLTAVLAAARLNAKEVGQMVKRVRLPDAGREGLSTIDRSIFEAMQRAALELLAGRTPPEEPASSPSTPDTRRAHLMRCVAGLPVRWHERIFLLTRALTFPIPAPEPPPPTIPAGIKEQDGRYFIAAGDIELIWVPPVEHWLGDDFDRAPPEPNPIHEATPAKGFFATLLPLTRGDLRSLAPSFAVEGGLDDEFFNATLDSARRFCEESSGKLNLSLELPTADEWEMTARGPDARRFPWGNGIEEGARELPSPWGALYCVGVLAQWTSSVSAESALPLVCGGEKSPRCAQRTPTEPHAEGVGLRLIIR